MPIKHIRAGCTPRSPPSPRTSRARHPEAPRRHSPRDSELLTTGSVKGRTPHAESDTPTADQPSGRRPCKHHWLRRRWRAEEEGVEQRDGVGEVEIAIVVRVGGLVQGSMGGCPRRRKPRVIATNLAAVPLTDTRCSRRNSFRRRWDQRRIPSFQEVEQFRYPGRGRQEF